MSTVQTLNVSANGRYFPSSTFSVIDYLGKEGIYQSDKVAHRSQAGYFLPSDNLFWIWSI